MYHAYTIASLPLHSISTHAPLYRRAAYPPAILHYSDSIRCIPVCDSTE